SHRCAPHWRQYPLCPDGDTAIAQTLIAALLRVVAGNWCKYKKAPHEAGRWDDHTGIWHRVATLGLAGITVHYT
ncbi:hypothetical protein KWH19_21515, partial [Xanthomonas campestris pv. pennamericanum]|uniref:hypothetical protein n=1 Tax=Xanthomonas euvesicatoria TaxID=456327 RepID=UPI001C48C634